MLTTTTGKATRMRRRERAEVENDAYMEMMRRCVRALGRRIASGDVEDIGKALQLRQELDDMMAVAVQQLNDKGESWARIGRGAGISKQAAQQRWGRRTEVGADG